jgi:hypothetical protein
VVGIANGITTLWNKITESKAKRQLAERTTVELAEKEVALTTCQRIQAWQWAALFVLAVLILAPKLSLARGA